MKKIATYLGLFIMLTAIWSCEDDNEIYLAADFEADRQSVAAGEQVTFNDLSTGNPATWNWKFEGGEPATSVLSSPTVQYNEPGTYGVTLELSNTSGAEVLIKEDFITVSYNAITPEFSSDKVLVIAGNEVSFTDESSGLKDTWSWEFTSEEGPIYSSNEQNPVITFEKEGTYTVKLTVSNPEFTEEIVKEDYLKVLNAQMVEADFVAVQTGTYEGGEITFNDQSVGTATAWEWTFEGASPATSTEQHPSVSYSTPGRYKVTLVASNDSETSTLVKEDYVVVVPKDRLAGYFPFDGNVEDVGPYNLESMIVGNVATNGEDHRTEGKASAVFDGASTLVLRDADPLNFGTDKFTISLWIKTDDTSKMMVWQESGANGSLDNQSWLRLGDNTSDRRIRFVTEDSSGGGSLNVGDADYQGGVSDGNWHHLVVVRDGIWPKIYINGNFVKEIKMPGQHDVSNDQDFKLGSQEGSNGYHTFFRGQLDDLIIYNRALSPDQVKELYNL